jgi:5-methylcytosine-specific restriction endonuclease McrBC regulatory subunit McrC
MPPVVLKIPERGSVDVPGAVWRAIDSDPHFWSLVERGVFSVEHRSAGGIRISAGCYVGRAIVGPDIVLELNEKIPGSLASLMAHATRINFRLERAPSPSSPLGPLISLLADQYVDAVSRYATRGRKFTYRRVQQVGSLIGGKINLAGTVQLRACGLRHLAQFEKNSIGFDTPANCVIFAALRELERIQRLIQIDQKTLARSRALAVFFSDCRNTEVLFGARTSLILNAAIERGKTRDPLLSDLMSLAGVILSHESFEHTGQSSGRVPRSWFLNLESLFERAVRNLLAEEFAHSAIVQNGRTTPTSIFIRNPLLYKALPDFVIRAGDSLCIIGDAKFKLVQQMVAPDDLYQLLVHAAAFGARTAFLVYPHDSFEVADQGIAATGAQVYRFTVNIAKLKENIASLVAIIRPALIPKS